MNAEEFLEKARTQIADDPHSRLTKLAKSTLKHPDCVIDIHAHIFDKYCLTVSYILLRMLKVITFESLGLESANGDVLGLELLGKDEDAIYGDIEEGQVDKDEDWDKLEKELEKMIEVQEMYELSGADLKEAFKVVKQKDMLGVLDLYHNEFAITKLPEFADRPMLLGILQMDLETGWHLKSKPRRPFGQQIKELKEISKQRPIIPYMAVDPRRADMKGSDENLYELFLEAFSDPEAPFFGVKCYPALGYYPSDSRLDPIFQICEEKRIPILTHCGGTTVSTFKKKVETQMGGQYTAQHIPGNSRKARAHYLNEPYHWEPVLQKYPKLKLNLGHFGGSEAWLNRSDNGSYDRLSKILEMMEKPEWKVYGDFSYNVINRKVFDVLKEKLDQDPLVASRILYGTDYWVVLPAGELLEMQDDFLKKMATHQQSMLRDNIIEYLLG